MKCKMNNHEILVVYCNTESLRGACIYKPVDVMVAKKKEVLVRYITIIS